MKCEEARDVLLRPLRFPDQNSLDCDVFYAAPTFEIPSCCFCPRHSHLLPSCRSLQQISVMFGNQFASPARNFLEHASFSASKLGSPIGNSTEISPALRQRANNLAAQNIPPPRLDQNNDNPMSVSARRLAAPSMLSTSSRSYHNVLRDWVYGIVHQRRNYAMVGNTLASAIIFTALNFFLKFSIWSPLTSVTDAVLSLFTLTWTQFFPCLR
uniref:PRA1 family protein n=1 Tax=Steinernema glaseri TaxID=37863 RepID=A0A1I7YJN9_9BILA